MSVTDPLAPTTIAWAVGVAAALAALAISGDWRRRQADAVDFGQPVAFSIAMVLAGCLLVMNLALAVTLAGIVKPLVAAAALWIGLLAVRRVGSLAGLRMLSLPLCLVSLGAAFMTLHYSVGGEDLALTVLLSER